MKTGDAAADFARGRVGDYMAAAGYCLQFTRENYPVGAVYASAIDAWNAAEHKHPDDDDPPVGTPVWYWSSSIYRHVAIYVGHRQVVTTYNDEIRLYSWDAMRGPFGDYMGWAEDLNGVRVWSPPPAPEPEPEPIPALRGEEMFVTQYGASAYRLVTGGVIVGIEGDTYNKLKAAGIPAVALKQSEVERLQTLLTFDKEPYKVKVID